MANHRLRCEIDNVAETLALHQRGEGIEIAIDIYTLKPNRSRPLLPLVRQQRVVRFIGARGGDDVVPLFGEIVDEVLSARLAVIERAIADLDRTLRELQERDA